jgi:hypothetical protein
MLLGFAAMRLSFARIKSPMSHAIKKGMNALFCTAVLGLLATDGEAKCLNVALVFAIDGSGSVSAPEYQFQQKAIASALRDPDVLNAMQQAGSVGMSAVFWGSARQSTQETPWMIIDDPTDADQLAHQIETLQRFVTGDTGLAAAMVRSLTKLEELTVCAARRIVNVSGDGRDTGSAPKGLRSIAPAEVRRLANDRDVTINALAISREERDLPRY